MNTTKRIASLSDSAVKKEICEIVQKAWMTHIDLENDVAVVNLTKILENSGGLLGKIAKAEGVSFKTKNGNTCFLSEQITRLEEKLDPSIVIQLREINSLRTKAAHNIRTANNQPDTLTKEDVERAFDLFLDFLEWYYRKYEGISKERLYVTERRNPLTIMDKVDEIHQSVIAEIEKLKADLGQRDKPAFFAREFEYGEKIVDRYIVEELVGNGKTSKMYRVKDKFHPLEDAKFALKVLLGSNEANKRVFQNEVRIRSQLNNQYVGRFIFADRVASEDFVLVLEYIDGEILGDWMKINGKQLEWEKFSDIIKKILFGLKYLHDDNIVHGDISPRSIVIENKTNNVKIVDFGSSGKVGEKVWAGEGKKAYQPLDLDKHGKHPGQDTYALGVMLYEYMFGTHPSVIEDTKRPETIKINISNPNFKKIILKACNPELEQRYKNAQDMYKALKDAKLFR